MTTNRERVLRALCQSEERNVDKGRLDRLEQALNAAEARGRRQALEWRPIETAPKDGSPVLMAVPAAGKWSICFGWIGDGSHPSRCATHWMPLPAGPQGDGDE